MSAELHPLRARIYVSFADEDRTRAMALVRWLNDGGWHVLADDRHAFPAASRRAPPRQIDRADIVLCVVTPGWLVSRYCHQEFSYSAKQGRFVLPVVCEAFDLGLLPPAVRVLPRVDLTQNRMVDYLDLKKVLTQAGSDLGAVAAARDDARRADRWGSMRPSRRSLGWLLGAATLAAAAGLWLWTRRA